jgi:hypothetical protein
MTMNAWDRFTEALNQWQTTTVPQGTPTEQALKRKLGLAFMALYDYYANKTTPREASKRVLSFAMFLLATPMGWFQRFQTTREMEIVRLAHEVADEASVLIGKSIRPSTTEQE